MDGMFEQASRLNLRFHSCKGLLTVEDLWDIPMTKGPVNIDYIAKDIYQGLKNDEVESFVVENQNTIGKQMLRLQFEIVKHIIKTRLKEIDVLKNAQVKKLKKQKIMAIIGDKQDESLKSASIEELQKMIDDI